MIKLTIERGMLLKALSHIQSVVERRQTIPVLSNVLVEAGSDEVLLRAGITFDDLDAYACNIGPGSFTGIRIGVSTVKGYQLAKPKKMIPS